jgi:hypothetical protein
MRVIGEVFMLFEVLVSSDQGSVFHGRTTPLLRELFDSHFPPEDE